VSAPLSPILTAVLKSARSELNARFAAARTRHPDLDGDVFADFVRSAIDPLVVAVGSARPERAPDVAHVAYDLALELVGQKLVGRSARTTVVADAWQRILPPVAALVATEPERLIASVCNASHQLSVTPGARPAFWVDTVAQLASQCADSRTLLSLGHVVAWRAGMAHLRESALAAADTLPESLVSSAIGTPAVRWLDVRDRLRADPWFDPSNPASPSGSARLVARAGGFRGFGGLFLTPPIVAMADEELLTRSGDSSWLLKADAFGATFHRATTDQFEQARATSRLPVGVTLRGTTVTVQGMKTELSGVIDEVSSACASHTTLALTSPSTHTIVLVALTSASPT
jgi:hypothetical protein